MYGSLFFDNFSTEDSGKQRINQIPVCGARKLLVT
jgi:hypothetical protein